MRLVQAYDLNECQDTYCAGVSNVEVTAPGVVRLAFYTEREDPDDGSLQRKVCDFQVWSEANLVATVNLLQGVLAEMHASARARPRLVAGAVH